MNLSGLSLRDLEYVVAIADHGSFVRAAEHCRVAQPSLSAQVRKLETWLGIVIFERTTRRVIVTVDGNSFIEQARRVLAEARLLFTIAQRSDAPFGGSLRLAAISTLGPYLFPRILSGLKRKYPDLSLVLSEGLTGELVPKLIDGQIDALLLSLPQSDSSVNLFRAVPAGMPKGAPGDAKRRADLGRARCRGTPVAGGGALSPRAGAGRLLWARPEQSSRHQPGNAEIHGRGR
jgi:LysR family transcriptional regulator, hydrogen peroxide-inducible genes activator